MIEFGDTKPLQPIYKQVKSIAPFCPICDQRLSGNNSLVLPYMCKCGEWQADTSGLSITYKIKV